MKAIILILFSFCTYLGICQNKLGNEWITGVGGQRIKFTDSGIFTNKIVFYSSYFTQGNSNICDTNGNLILCSDGYNIYDSNANFIDGGDTLIPENFYIHEYGWSLYAQSSIFLPIDSNKYYFITPTFSDLRWADCLANNHCSFDLLLYNLVDMNANAGAGKVIKRMEQLMTNAELSKTQMMACRHSNGKDWWLLKQGLDSNIIYKFLFKQDTVENRGFQKFDAPVWGEWDRIGQSMFSQDGSKYATIVEGDSTDGVLFLADFDRCYGNLSNPKVIHAPIMSCHNPMDTTIMDETFGGVAFSPDGNKLYALGECNIFQYDLVDESWYHVAGLDTTWQKFQMYSNLYLGPDDKLYIGNWNGLSKQMSVINNPNVKGAGCNFCPRCLRMDTLVGGSAGTPPCMPNYSLGAQTCWPLGLTPEASAAAEEGGLHVYPNPASTMIYIKIARLNDPVGQASKSLAMTNQPRELYNSVGQLLFSTKENEIDLSADKAGIRKYSSGVYYLKVGNQVRKVVIE